jgi:glycosyltransferase involved in cell wall biosynthesis
MDVNGDGIDDMVRRRDGDNSALISINKGNGVDWDELDELGCRTVYEASDAMLHMAWRDHCPNACVEALAVGTPVVCASSGGTPELIDATCGTIIDDAMDSSIDRATFDYDAPPVLDVMALRDIPQRGSFDTLRFSIQTAALAYEAAMHEVLSR